MAEELTWPAVMAWRVERQGLAAREPAERWMEVARRVCGLHAQLARSAELTLWARVDDVAPGTLETALWTDRTLVRTWAMRGTLHLLAAEHKGRVYRPQGWLSPVLLVDGQIAGVWRHTLKGGRLSVVIEAFGGLDPVVREGTEAEAARLAAYLGGELDLSFEPLD